MDQQRLIFDNEDFYTSPTMNWLFKPATKRLNKHRLDSSQMMDHLADMDSKHASEMMAKNASALQAKDEEYRVTTKDLLNKYQKAMVYPTYVEPQYEDLNSKAIVPR